MKTKEELEEEEELENARLLSIQENNKIVQKENANKEKETANEILESQDFFNDLLSQVDFGSNEPKKEEDNKKEEDIKKKEENEKKKEDNKRDKKKEDDKMNIDK